MSVPGYPIQRILRTEIVHDAAQESRAAVAPGGKFPPERIFLPCGLVVCLQIRDPRREPRAGYIADQKYGTCTLCRNGCQHIIDLEVTVLPERNASQSRVVQFRRHVRPVPATSTS
jgi:hypothetical protein